MPPRTESQTELCLSLEELTLTFSLLGQAPLAKTMLNDRLGERNADEIRGRMMAAGNGLLAKGVFFLDGDKLAMAQAYADVFRPMINAEYTLQCTAFGADTPVESLTIYVQENQFVEHVSHDGIFHSLQMMAGLSAAIHRIEDFFQLPFLDDFQVVPFKFNQEQALEARLLGVSEPVDLRDRLEQQGVDAETATKFAEDLNRPQKWAIATRMRTAAERGIEAELGYLALAAVSGRTWLMTIDGDNGRALLNARSAGRDAIRALTRALLVSG